MPKTFSEQMHNTVSALRKQAGLSQQALADTVDVSRQTIVAIEKGNYAPSVLLALKIANALGVTVETLFSYEEQ